MNAPSSYPLRRLLWLTGALFLSYLAVSMPLSVISVDVERRLGLSNALGGLAVGIAFLSTILTRAAAGRLTDRAGGKRAMVLGLALYALAGLICLAAAIPGLPPFLAYGVLIAGRLVLGLGESQTLVGMLGWGIGLAGAGHAGRFLALMGAGMYGSFALGGPLGVYLYGHGGLGPVMGAAVAAPLVGLAMVAGQAKVAPPPAGERAGLGEILGRIWRQGAVVGLQGVGFAALGAFLSALFMARGWDHPGLGLSLFAAGFVSMRVLGGHFPERFGAGRVALISLGVEAVGQALLWLAPSPAMALAGALLTGAGCSLIYPAMGSTVVMVVPPRMRATAMGTYSAFQDLAYGATGPLAGLAADRFGLPAVFLIGLLAALAGMLAVANLARR